MSPQHHDSRFVASLPDATASFVGGVSSRFLSCRSRLGRYPLPILSDVLFPAAALRPADSSGVNSIRIVAAADSGWTAIGEVSG